MPKLRIKNCGPIDEGFTTKDGFISLSKFLLFVGDQGTGTGQTHYRFCKA